MESSKNEPETIDVSELMLGLDDDDDDDDNDNDDADERHDPGSIHLPLASTLRTDSLASLKHESMKVSHRRPRRSMVYNPQESVRQYPPADQTVIQEECGSSSSVLFGDEASIFLSENPVAYDEDEISPRSVSFRFRFKAGSKAKNHQHHGKREDLPGTTTTTTRLSGEGETPTSPSPPYSFTSTSTSPSGGLLKQWFQRSSREKKHSSPVGFKSLFRESRPTKSSDHYENHRANILDFKSLEANANSRAWHSFSNVNRNQQLVQENVLHHPTTTTKGSEKILNDPSVKMTTLYSTNDRAEADAYEDCNAARAILISLVGTSFDEKSISLHPYHELELKNALNIPMTEVLVVPILYVRGEYVVGIDNIMQLYKKGELGSLLLQTLPHGLNRDSLCTCRGGRFLVCPLCKGKGKLSRKGQEPMRCRHCSATGLLKCPNCLYS